MLNHVAPYRYMLPNLYLSVANIANPDFFACVSRTWISLDIGHFYEEYCQPSSGSAWPACTKNGNRSPITGGGRGQQNLHRVCQTAMTAPPRVGWVVWNLVPNLLHLYFSSTFLQINNNVHRDTSSVQYNTFFSLFLERYFRRTTKYIDGRYFEH